MQRRTDVSVLAEAPDRVHLVGISGSGVRGLVELLLARGARLSGSDRRDSEVMARLRDIGVPCSVGHTGPLDPETQLLVVSAAVPADNPEVQAAKHLKLPVLKYAECLGYLMSGRDGIAIAGTHGKTTTSAMTSYVLREAGLDPSFVIGGDAPVLGGSSHSGAGRHFVAEACEFDRSFLNLRARAAVVTNIEEEHLDYFESLDEIESAFGEFVGLLPDDGLLIYNRDDPNSSLLPLSTRAEVQSFSLDPGRGDWWAEDIELHGEGCRFTLCGPVGEPLRVSLQVPGIHNVRNALATAALCSWAGCDLEDIVSGLESFRGVRRRFDILARAPFTVVDDYAHHPTEVETVLRSARQAYPERQIVCVFQPHQYSRLRRMCGGFARALQAADQVVVTGVYESRDREEDIRSVHPSLLVESINDLGAEARLAPTFADVRRVLKETLLPRAVVLFLGAGDVTELAQEFAANACSRKVASSGAGVRLVEACSRTA